MALFPFEKIADSLDSIPFSGNGMVLMEIKGRPVCLVRIRDEIMACSARCPHAGGMLTDGYVDALGNIVCPVHHYRFNLRTGRDAEGEGYFLKRYVVENREDGIFIQIP